MTIYQHFQDHFRRLHEIFFVLVKAEHDQSEQLAAIRRETFALHKENLEEARQIKHQLAEIRQIGGDILLVSQLIKEIHLAVVPELVTKIHLATETGDHMDISVGQTSTLTFQAFGASGNPTVPVGQPSFSSTNSTDFTVEPANGVVSVSPSAAAGATTDVSVTVDGITSNTVSYTVAAPAAEPVASVVLTGSTPA